MRRISSEIDKKIEPFRIHLDSLQKIYDRLVEFQSSGDKAGSITLRTRDHEFSSVEELAKELKSTGLSQIHKLDLIAFRRTGDGDSEGTFLYMSGGGCYIQSAKSDLLSLAVVEAVCQELQINRHPLRYFANLVRVWGFILAGGVLSTVAGLVLKKQASVITVLYMICNIFAVAAMIYVINNHSTIVLDYKSDAPSFWKRNKDTLIVGLIMALVGAILATAVTWYFAAAPSPAPHK